MALHCFKSPKYWNYLLDWPSQVHMHRIEEILHTLFRTCSSSCGACIKTTTMTKWSNVNYHSCFLSLSCTTATHLSFELIPVFDLGGFEAISTALKTMNCYVKRMYYSLLSNRSVHNSQQILERISWHSCVDPGCRNAESRSVMTRDCGSV